MAVKPTSIRQTQDHRPSRPRVRAPRSAVEATLRRQAAQAVVPQGLRAIVSLEVGAGKGWTAQLAETVEVSHGLPERSDVRIIAPPEVITAVVGGEESGIKAFLDGRLLVRGNLALALRLDSIFKPQGRPVHWPKWGDVRARGLHTAYLEAGSGPPLVLLHGLGATNASLLPTLWELAANYRVIAPDLPGFGESAKPLRSYNAAFFSHWLQAFLDELGIERTDLLGNSMGGRVAIELGLRAPERVRRMVLLAPSPAFIRRREFVRLVRLLRPELAVLPVPIPHRQVVRATRAMFSRPSRLPDGWYDAAADEFLRVFATARGRIAFFSAARQIYLEEPRGAKGFWDRLPGLATPALFVWGARDRLVPAKFARHVVDALPNATSVVFEDCGHVPQYELPAKTHRLVRDFLAADKPLS
ncbi:MAG TPA: alpha/beta fold hydrolase [Actinomycetota bacterium]